MCTIIVPYQYQYTLRDLYKAKYSCLYMTSHTMLCTDLMQTFMNHKCYISKQMFQQEHDIYKTTMLHAQNVFKIAHAIWIQHPLLDLIKKSIIAMVLLVCVYSV